jgi:predicted PurR-regulated permease PerM
MEPQDTDRHHNYLTTGVWVIATVCIGWALHEGSEILGPFALAVLIWLVMEGLAREISRRIKAAPKWVGHLFAIAIVVVSFVMAIGILRGAVEKFAANSDGYGERINQTIVDVYALLGLQDPPELSSLIYSNAILPFVQPALTTVQGMASGLTLVLIYVGFLYFAGHAWPTKMRNIFERREDRKKALQVFADIRRAMEQYLWVQTLLSLITSTLTYFTLLAAGLDNALFWAFVIFFLNYIPTLGSIIASLLPTIFALVQIDWPGWMPAEPMWCALIVFLGVSVWQFGIGNFVSPRMTGNRLNISSLTVLLSLAVWGGLWGPAGVFLSAPLTVLIMIVLAEIPGARWIAVLLSEDGNPGGAKAEAVAETREKDADRDGREARHEDSTGRAPAE